MRVLMRVLIAALLLATTPIATWSQEPAAAGQPAPSPWTKERIDSPPQREIKFERSSEVKKLRLPRADVKLLEMKYSAVVKLAVPADSGWHSNASQELKSPAFNRWFSLFSRGDLDTGPLPVAEDKYVTLQDAFQAAIDAMPAEQRPAQDVIDYFVSERISSNLIVARRRDAPRYATAGRQRMEPRYIVEIELLAASPEQAEQVAAGFVRILDWGVCRRIQQDIWNHYDEADRTLATSRQKMDEYTQTLGTFAEEIKQLGAMRGDEGRAGLATLYVQLLVEQTGIKARIQACDKLLAQAGLSPARRERLEDEKLAAEIELASVEARRKTLDAATGFAREQQTIRSRQSWVHTLDMYLTQYAPPQLVEGAVLIQPLEWQ